LLAPLADFSCATPIDPANIPTAIPIPILTQKRRMMVAFLSLPNPNSDTVSRFSPACQRTLSSSGDELFAKLVAWASMLRDSAKPVKILLIGNYPPPLCGWAMQTCLVIDELRHRGHVCQILKINENRQLKSPQYVDVQNGLDYLLKLVRYAARGFRLNPHMNGKSKKVS